ncbi:hypothetical protein [Granulicella sp. L46]|uniref:hypothetical protein n=1 Tax=Granulicella sp. L46 TaxID=1641865 RepID=UPI00131C2740|nr:hypothetical protein [Granulicella sp. L46]
MTPHDQSPNPTNPAPNDDQLRRVFRTYAAALSAEHTPPPATAILFRAERRRRRAAIQRAERPLLIMQTLGVLSAVFAAAWLLYRFAPHTFPTLNSTTLALSIACTTLVLAGCWTMLRASRPSA